jgi:hypothetical protein
MSIGFCIFLELLLSLGKPGRCETWCFSQSFPPSFGFCMALFYQKKTFPSATLSQKAGDPVTSNPHWPAWEGTVQGLFIYEAQVALGLFSWYAFPERKWQP